ncbi:MULTISPECIES: hypothetical protein [Thauera]|jgi:hypothetical protein|uniref:Uncharacterized protein n=1 Tax=Thauera humireducens TaxID=1134435 RepID=A0A127KA99_9RHOO|nr:MULTISPECIES: hypothetical protein [Thauera]AMO38893.1 hypothetical protein AC731_019280 [Thauera humireducens]ENO77885.1 hypothetical protein C664_10143 [Thauera sp. 63]CAH1745508.1 conserved exported protein of unknown function [Thauera humireducens]
MIKRQTIAALITTTALAYSICTPAQAASLLSTAQINLPSNCSGDKHEAGDLKDKVKKPVQG